MHTLSKLKERGWTDKLIKELLGDPDATARNPHYRKAADMKLFDETRVEQAENNDIFRHAQIGRDKRLEAAKKAVETRRATLQRTIENLEIDLDDVGVSEHEKSKREIVNELRHECTDYDDLLAHHAIRHNASNIKLIRRKVYDAIAQSHPHLKDECERQFRERS